MFRLRPLSFFVWAVTACNPDPPTMSATTGSSADTVTESVPTEPGCAATPSASDECDVGCQNCGADQKCVALAEDGKNFTKTACRPIPEAPKAPGERCAVLGEQTDGDDDCQRGSACVGFPLFPDTQCVEFCETSEGGLSCSDASTRCVELLGRPLCVPICDPRAPGACDFGCRSVDLECPGCFPMSESGVFTCWYPPPEENVAGFPCPFNECQETLFCGPPGRVAGCDENTPCCTPYCDLTDPSCDDGASCTAVFDVGAAPKALESLGACLTP